MLLDISTVKIYSLSDRVTSPLPVPCYKIDFPATLWPKIFLVKSKFFLPIKPYISIIFYLSWSGRNSFSQKQLKIFFLTVTHLNFLRALKLLDSRPYDFAQLQGEDSLTKMPEAQQYPCHHEFSDARHCNILTNQLFLGPCNQSSNDQF